MAKIEDREPKETSGGYDRLFGIPPLGQLISKVQGTVIASGTELERMIQSRCECIEDLDEFLRQEIMQDGVFIAPKKEVKRCKTLRAVQEPDFLIFKRRRGEQRCYVIELKDGHVFDTKKASAERRSMHSFVEKNAQHLPYKVQCHFCAFNQVEKDAIIQGFKRKITEKEAMTGPEFCDLLEIDYEEIVRDRSSDQEANVEYFLLQLLSIKKVRKRLKRLLKKRCG